MPFNRFEQAFGSGGGQGSQEGWKLKKDGTPKMTGRGRKGTTTEQGDATRAQKKRMKEMRERQRQQRSQRTSGDVIKPIARYKPGLSRKDRSGGR